MLPCLFLFVEVSHQFIKCGPCTCVHKGTGWDLDVLWLVSAEIGRRGDRREEVPGLALAGRELETVPCRRGRTARGRLPGPVYLFG